MFFRNSTIAFTFLLATALGASAAPGALDCSFGNNGTLNYDLTSLDAGYDIARQSDGKLVVVHGEGGSVRLSRFSPGGSPDLSFGSSNGSIVHAFSGLGFAGEAELDSQGRIVVAGRINQGDEDAFVARFTSTGAVDTSFGGGDGWAGFDFDAQTAGSGLDSVSAMSVVAADKIVLAGVMDPSGNNNGDFALARVTSVGVLDSSFGGGDGVVVSGVTGDDDARGLAVDSQGRLLVSGSSGNIPAPRNSIVARLSAAGVLDSSFNSTGTKIIDMTEAGADDFGVDVTVDNLDRALVYGSSGDDPAIARLTSAGALDTTFATDGILQRSFIGGQDVTEHIFWQTDGRIIVTGWPVVAGNFRFAAMRFTSAGAIDTSWGTNGVVTTAFGAQERAYAGLLQPNQRLVLAGGLGNDQNLGMVRFLNDNDAQTPTAITAFSATPNPSEVGQAITVAVNIVASAGALAPTGKVIFSEGNSTCSATLSPTVGLTASGNCQLSLNNVGNRTITAQFDGDVGFCRSASSTTHQVNLPATVTSLTSVAPNPSRIGEVVEAAFTVSASAPGAITGLVTVSDGVHSCSESVQVGRCSMVLSTAGERTFSASYAGNGNFSGSVSTPLAHSVRLVVTPVVIPSGGGSFSPATEQLVVLNAQSTFAVSANAGYRLQAVSGCGGTLTGANYTTAAVSANCSVSAIFNQNPIANPGTLSVLEDGGATAGTLSGTDDGVLNFSLTSAPAKGTVSLINASTGAFSYTPNSDANGSDSFSFKVNDGGMDSNIATVSINITPVNDRPSLTFAINPSHPAATMGTQSLPNFAGFDAGPSDEDANQSVSNYLIDNVIDPVGVLSPGTAINSSGTLSYALTGIGGTATVSARVRDSGGVANGGVDTSMPATFSITVALGADLQIAIDNERSTVVAGSDTLYKIVVANAGPNAAVGARVQDALPVGLTNAVWTCRADLSSVPCPTVSSGVGNLDSLITLPINGVLRFDLFAVVSAAPGGFIVNTAAVSTPANVTSLNPSNDSASDQDAVIPDGLFLNGFEENAPLTVPEALRVLRMR